MLDAFIISFRLRNTYKTNGIIYSLKSLPLVKKLLPSSLYASRGLKVFANVFSIILEFFSIFIGKALYLLIVYLAATNLKSPPADSFVHILVFLTIIGGFMNSHIFNPTKDKYYAMFIMRMDARKYTLSGYLNFLLKMLVGFLIFSLIFGSLCGLGLLTCFAIPFFVVSVKLCATALSLDDKNGVSKTTNENRLKPLLWVCTAVLLAAAFAPPYFGYAISTPIFSILTAILLIPAAFAMKHILRFKGYRAIYKDLLKPENFAMVTSKKAVASVQQLSLQKKISMDSSQTSNKEGYQYFNELFMKRHAKLLTKSAKRITAIAFILFAAAIIALQVFPATKKEVNKLMLTFLPYFLFVMYMINRGKVITQAMFMNCDHSMLTYRFYRQPNAVLTLFIERLKYIIAINLMPASVIALGLPILLYITGSTDQPLNYLLLFVSIIAMSVFFSVHSIVLYYLLQPYNVDLESKNAAYWIVNSVTYLICYIAIGKQIPTLAFGTAISAFCIIYVVVASILAYRLAPQTFKLRQ